MDDTPDKMEATTNMLVNPQVLAIGEPNDCPTPIPNEINVPQIAIPRPLRLSGRISVIKAVAPVGVKPAPIPCKNRKARKNTTD